MARKKLPPELKAKNHTFKLYDWEVEKVKEYIKWRKAVYERDDYTCQICGKRGGTLNAHHIKHFAKNKDLRTDINNGITLCEDCHKAIHRGTICRDI